MSGYLYAGLFLGAGLATLAVLAWRDSRRADEQSVDVLLALGVQPQDAPTAEVQALLPTDMDAAIRLMTETFYAQPVNETDPNSTGEDHL